MKFDFTNFTEKVAELNRLNKSVHELSDLRWRTQNAEDIDRWGRAVAAWKEYSGFGEDIRFYFFENNTFLSALAAGEADAKTAVAAKAEPALAEEAPVAGNSSFDKLWTPVGKKSHLFICSFSASGNAEKELENGVFRLNYEQKNELMTLIEYIRMENSSLPRTDKRNLEPWDKSPYFSAIVAKRLELIIMMIIENSKKVRPVQNNKDVSLYNAIIKMLDKNISGQVSVPDIAKKFSISVSKLNKLFSSYAGCGVHTYHIKMKIQKAVKLLSNDIPANVISDMLGFNNPNYFSLTFKRETGFSPLNYKKRFM